MSYFIFQKNSDNITGTIYRIAENQSDLNNLNIDIACYKIIEDSQSNFDDVKYGVKQCISYSDNLVNYANTSIVFNTKEDLQFYIDGYKKAIKNFLDNNKNHPLFNIWSNYLNQLNSLNLNNILYPLNNSLEKYFSDQSKTSLNPLQLP